MKLRLFAIALAAATLALGGCGDDITNFIESSATPTMGTPPTSAPATNTSAPATNTPVPTNTTAGTPVATPTPGGTVICGDGQVEDPETCDDGGICFNDPEQSCTSPDDCGGNECRTVGGDGCAANCTVETQDHRISAPFGEGSGSLVQTALFPIAITLTGTQTVQAGDIRDDAVMDVNGLQIFEPGDIPVSVKAEDVRINPVIVPGLVCACVRGIEVPVFGAGNSATGRVACGDDPQNFDYVLYQDHNTNPGGANRNPDCALDLDPECDDSFRFPSGVISDACEEQVDEPCIDAAVHIHPNVCNSPRVIEFGGGSAPRGSALINNNTAIGLLSDGGSCDMTIAGTSPCPYASYGDDCIPCTDDDTDKGNPENIPTTTGTAKAVIYNANNNLGRTIQQGSQTPCTPPAAGQPDPCTEASPEGLCGGPERCLPEFNAAGMQTGNFFCGIQCGGRFCLTQSTGAPFDCDTLMNDPQNGLSGGALAVTFPSIDANLIQDNTTSTRFAFE